MKTITITALLVLFLTLFLSNSVFAHCGACGVAAAAQTVSSTETIKGDIVCLGCTLKKEQGAKAQCSVYGHVNGLRTSDGRIWTFLENDNSTKLVNDHSLVGKSVEIKGKKYKDVNYIEVEGYEIF